MAKRNVRHFWKAEMKGKIAGFFVLIFVVLKFLITSSVYIFKARNKAKMLFELRIIEIDCFNFIR